MTKQFCDKCNSEILEQSLKGYVRYGIHTNGSIVMDAYMSRLELCEGCYNEMFSFVKK